jgi:hypothetical protein
MVTQKMDPKKVSFWTEQKVTSCDPSNYIVPIFVLKPK